MVDHFSKYGWARWIADKTTQITIKALKSWLTTHNKSDIIQSENRKEFTSREFKQFLAKLNIQQIFGMPYNPKSQGVVKIFNKTIKKFLESAKYYKKEKFDLEDSINDFLCYYNNKKHSTTQTSPYEVMKNMDD